MLLSFSWSILNKMDEKIWIRVVCILAHGYCPQCLLRNDARWVVTSWCKATDQKGKVGSTSDGDCIPNVLMTHLLIENHNYLSIDHFRKINLPLKCARLFMAGFFTGSNQTQWKKTMPKSQWTKLNWIHARKCYHSVATPANLIIFSFGLSVCTVQTFVRSTRTISIFY